MVEMQETAGLKYFRKISQVSQKEVLTLWKYHLKPKKARKLYQWKVNGFVSHISNF